MEIEKKIKSKKYAVLSMDIEDWHHLDYFAGMPMQKSYSMLDGIEQYAELIQKHNIKSTFFAISDIAPDIASQLRNLVTLGHEIACHGKNHERPLTKSTEVLAAEIKQAKLILEDISGKKVEGYRAPCFSIDRERLDSLINIGMLYDSSKIAFGNHPLYGDLNVDGFKKIMQDVYLKDEFIEFELSTLQIANRHIPVSGGGYLRILPWTLMNYLLKKYLEYAEFYVLYIHPFELSKKELPPIPKGAGMLKTIRFTRGHGTVAGKLEKLIIMLKESGFEFTTFNNLHKKMTSCVNKD